MTRVVFDNTDLSEFGYTFHKDIDEVPEHDYEEVTILGKNGTLLIDNKRMKNVSESYDIAITDNSTADLDKLRNFLASKVGFKRLEDDIRPDRFVMAKFDGMNSRLPSDRSKATATIKFTRKPERWLKSGEIPVSASSQSVSYTGNPAEIDNPSGISAVSSLAVALNPVQNLNGYDSPWIGGAGKNKLNLANRTVAQYDSPTAIATEQCTVVVNGDVITGTVIGAWSKVRFGLDVSKLEDGATYTWSVQFNNPSGGTIGVSYLANGTWSGTVVNTSTSIKLSTTFTYTSSITSLTIAAILNNTNASTGNVVTVSEMQLEKGSTATTYAPYENVCPIYPANGKNLLNVPNMDTTFGALTVKSNNGVCVANGTATSNTTCTLLRMTGTLPAGEYTLNGNANFTQQIVLQVYSYTRSSNIARCLSNADVTFTVNANEDIAVVLYVFNGQTLNNFTFYPMIRRADITDQSYVPYQGIALQQTGRNLYPIAIGRDVWANNVSATHTTDNDVLTLVCASSSNSGVYSHITSTIRQLATQVSGTHTYSFYIRSTTSGNYTFLVGYENYGWKTVTVNGTWQRVEITVSFTATAANCVFYNRSGSAVTVEIKDFMLEYGSEAHDYEPYAGTSYPYTLGQNVYGGTVDLATGVLTVDRRFVTLSNFVKETSYDVGNSSLFSATVSGANSNPSANRGSISDKLKYDTTILNAERTGFYVGYNHVYARITGISTLSDFNTAIGGELSVAYTLATPTTVQLTPQQISLLTGINYISSSDEVTGVISEPSLLENPTLFESKPLIRVYGNGTLVINHQYITVAEHPYEYIDIDCDMMDCYYDGNNANQYVSFSTNDYVVLKSGANYIAYSGRCEITPRWYEV